VLALACEGALYAKAKATTIAIRCVRMDTFRPRNRIRKTVVYSFSLVLILSSRRKGHTDRGFFGQLASHDEQDYRGLSEGFQTPTFSVSPEN
jgi:hypothetical protein